MIDLPYPQQPRNKNGCGLLLIILTLLYLLFFTTVVWESQTTDNSDPLALVGMVIGMMFFRPILDRWHFANQARRPRSQEVEPADRTVAAGKAGMAYIAILPS